MSAKKKLTKLILIIQLFSIFSSTIEIKNQISSQCFNSNDIKILDCKQNSGLIVDYLPNYECNCNRFKNGEIFNCLKVYVGMAIKGHNLLYNRWIDKENCMNICLNTTVNNGHKFNCKSFEHWHGNCTYSPYSNNSNAQSCASFNGKQKISRRYFHEKQFKPKLDYCVLSDQTINSVGSDFNSNNAVTYYELTCQRDVTLDSKHQTYSKMEKKLPTNKSIFNIVPSEKYRSNECSFNPCLNAGTCVLGKNNRFICLCDKFHYGINCENGEIKYQPIIY